MKKSIKNTIMIGMAAVLIGTSAVTISYAQNGRGTQMMPMQSQSEQFDGQFQNGQFGDFKQDGNFQNGKNFKQNQMPGNQQGDSNSTQQPQAPGSQQGDSNSSQQPQAPSDSNDSNSNSNSQKSQSSNSDNSKSDSSSTNTSLSIESLAADDAESQNTAQQNFPSKGFKNRNGGIISALCYMFAALQIAILLAMIAYLIISKMNRISFNEVLANMRKKQ